MAEIEIAVINTAQVHFSRHFCHVADQCPLEWQRWRIFRPVAAEILEADRRLEFFGDDEGMLCRRMTAAPPESDTVHGIDAQLRQPVNRLPFIGRTKHRQTQTEQVLDITILCKMQLLLATILDRVDLIQDLLTRSLRL